jgi:hypothetical protein
MTDSNGGQRVEQLVQGGPAGSVSGAAAAAAAAAVASAAAVSTPLPAPDDSRDHLLEELVGAAQGGGWEQPPGNATGISGLNTSGNAVFPGDMGLLLHAAHCITATPTTTSSSGHVGAVSLASPKPLFNMGLLGTVLTCTISGATGAVSISHHQEEPVSLQPGSKKMSGRSRRQMRQLTHNKQAPLRTGEEFKHTCSGSMLLMCAS